MNVPTRQLTTKCFLCGRALQRMGEDFAGKQIYQCSYCDFVMTPSSTSEEAATLYDDPEYFHAWGANLEFDYDRFDLSAQQQVNEYLDFIKAHTRGRTLLDVGTGSGLLPRMARSLGYEVEGTDLSRHITDTVPIKAGFPIHHGLIEQIHFDRKYDIVTMLHVLEHTREPLVTMKRAREILNDEGFIVVVVPNYRSLDTRLKNLLSRFKLKSRPYKHLALGHHNYVFSLESLENLGRKTDLRIIHRETRGPARRASSWHRVLAHYQLATWCWVVYQKLPGPK